MEQSKKRLKETQEELSEEAAAKVCHLYIYTFTPVYNNLSVEHYKNCMFLIFKLLIYFVDVNIKPLWLGDIFTHVEVLHSIGFGVLPENELSVSLSPFGMFSVLLCVCLFVFVRQYVCIDAKSLLNWTVDVHILSLMDHSNDQ